MNDRSRYSEDEWNDDFTRQSDREINYDALEERWFEIEDDYRSRYSELTDEDVLVNNGRFDETLDRIGRRRGKSPSEVRTEIENW